MKRLVPDLALCLLLAGIISVHFFVGFSNLVYTVINPFSQSGGGLDSPVVAVGGTGAPGALTAASSGCDDVRYDPAHVDEALACRTPFEDPADDVSASDRPSGHLVSIVLFAVLMPLIGGLAVFFNRRHIADWIREKRLHGMAWPVSVEGDRKPAGIEIVLLFAVLAAAVFTRVFHLGTWVVEESEWGAVERLPLMDLMFHGRETMHEPPLFTTLQHFVYMINDGSLAWTRSLTCLTGVLLVVAVWRSSRMIFGPKTALLASALAAVHPFMVSNSHVMRPYSLVSFFLVMALPHAFRLASGGRRRDIAAFSIFGGLAIWTHYTALISLFVLFVYMASGLVRDRSDRGGRLLRLAVAGVVLLVFFLPFVPYFFSDFSDKQGAWVSPEFVDDMLSALTGLPFGLGWIVLAFPLVTGLRRAKSGRFLMIFGGGIVILTLSTIWMVWWEPTHLAILAPVLTMAVAASAVRVRARLAPAMLAPYFVGMAVMTAVLFSLPSSDPTVWEAVRPMTWHGMSYQRQAAKVLDLMGSDPATFTCRDVYMTPVDQISGFMYYWGPVTPQQIGMKPIEPNNFKTFTMTANVAGRRVSMNLNPVERLWSWEKGQWMDLEMALRDKGCLWYQKSYQNCRLKTGRFYSSNDCRWLAANCRAVDSMPDGELYYCTRDIGISPR